MAGVKLDHVAIGLPTAGLAKPFFEDVLGGAPAGGHSGVPFGFTQWAFAGGGKIEVIYPMGPPDGFLHRFLAHGGPRIHHVTFKVPSLDEICARATELGYTVVGTDRSDPHWQEAFLHPKQAQGIVVQLVESKPRPGWDDGPAPKPRADAARVRGLRLSAKSADASRRQWSELLGAECSRSGESLRFRWADSPLAISRRCRFATRRGTAADRARRRAGSRLARGPSPGARHALRAGARVTRRGIVLHQFPYSHYAEKARWALDWKRIPHERVDYLPGPHVPQMLRLSGQQEVPVLQIGERVIAGSAAIIDELEKLFPEPALYPADPEQRERALALQRHFDVELGPRIRRALFSVLIREPAYMCRIFAGRRSAPVRAAYRALFPATKQVMGRSMALFDARAIEDSFRGTREALDRVAKEVAGSGQLVGDRFGIADLTAAAFFALLLKPDHPDMARPEPVPERVRELMSGFAPHAGMHWALEQYRLHRPIRTGG